MFSEREKFSTVFYGYLPPLIISPNTNATIPLVYVSDRHETGYLTLFVNRGNLNSLNLSSSVSILQSYNLEMGFYANIQVNKSAFALLVESNYAFHEPNTTVNAVAFHSTNFPPGGPKSTEAQPIESGIQLNKLYQLKIGNYETYIVNQTGPLRFTAQKTNRSLEVVITGQSSPVSDLLP